MIIEKLEIGEKAEKAENLKNMFYTPALVDIVDDRVFSDNLGLEVTPELWLLRISLWGVLNTICQ